jgi:hypothetical protein
MPSSGPPAVENRDRILHRGNDWADAIDVMQHQFQGYPLARRNDHVLGHRGTTPEDAPQEHCRAVIEGRRLSEVEHEVMAAFRSSGLDRYPYRDESGDHGPTLAELIEQDSRLVVFAEKVSRRRIGTDQLHSSFRTQCFALSRLPN